jgi:hypothetical protein
MMAFRTRRTRVLLPVALTVSGLASVAQAGGIPGELEEVTVTAKRIGLMGRPVAASQGTVLAGQLAHRPVLRTAEVLEVVPGLVVTQHSGDGKANQYFLRGFNLDHGTDFATYVEGMPVNMPTHGHGQGYSDLNFFIPELAERLDYRKGTYYADQGNFSAAGAVSIRYQRRLDSPFLMLDGGADSFSRFVAAASPRVGEGDLLLAMDDQRTDGPWQLDENLHKFNALAKYSRGSAAQGWSLTLMGYDGKWRSTDQIPLRAVQSGDLDRFGFIDPTDGGNSHRYSLSGEGWDALGSGQWRGLVYGIDYDLELFSNFTYFTDPTQGDQFEQADSRRVYGGEWRFMQPFEWLGREAGLQTGVQVRVDDIDRVGLYRTRERVRTATIREDAVKQASYAAFASVDTRWTSWLRSEIGARADFYDFDVDSSLAVNSGSASDSIVSPKLSLTFGPWRQTELFLNAGRGFHSNDARGTTITVDPNDGAIQARRVDALVRAKGSEIGVRSAPIRGLQLSASLWRLELDSELLFVGDGGTTEPSRPTRRSGLELGAYYAPFEWLIIDADLAFSKPRFTDDDSTGDRIPGAVERVASIGVALNHSRGWFGGARLRYLGPAALIEDNSVRSKSTTLVNLEGGYRFSKRLSARMGLFNVFDSRGNDITYFYESQLPGEAAPVADIHFHPVEPRTWRAGVRFEL